MEHTRQYQEYIIKEVQNLPIEALPKLLRLIRLVREEFLMQETPLAQAPLAGETSHEKTRRLLATSETNWAQALIADREDRV